MYYIKSEPTANGNYGNPQSDYADGLVALPAELLGDYLAAMGFVTLTVEDDTVTALTINQEAYDAYVADHKEPDPWRAERDYEPGEYLTIESTMYRVLLPIYAGTQITPGTNVEETTIEAELAREEN